MIKWILCLIFLSFGAQGQDERVFRKLFSSKEEVFETQDEPRLILEAAPYKFDLDGDQKSELIKAVRKDGIDYVQILDSDNNLLKEIKFQSKGAEANLYKIRSTFVKPGVLLVVMYFDEGFTKSRRFKNTARTYFLTVKNGDWSNGIVTKGPSHFIEQEYVQGRYFRRGYQVNIQDLNQDGIKEISVNYGSINRIFFYKNGAWKSQL